MKRIVSLFLNALMISTMALLEISPALAKSKAPRAPAIERVFEKRDANQTKEAVSVAHTLNRSHEFFDLARLQVALFVDPQTVTSADQILSDLFYISTQLPYSSTQREIHSAIARIQIKKAVLLSKTRKKAARQLFEEAFQRLGTKAQFLDKLSKTDIESYCSLATQSRTEIGDAWLARLAAYYPKAAVETASLRKWMAENKVELPVSNGSSEKINQTYRATDSDLDAYSTAMAEILDTHSSKSISLLQRFLDEYPRSAYRHRVKWWLANLLEKKGKDDRAKGLRDQIISENPFSLFAILSARSLSRDLMKELNTEKPTPNETQRDPALTPAELTSLARAEKLIKQRAFRAAAFELREVRSKENFSSGFLTYLARIQSEVGNIVQSFGSISELLARGDGSIASSRGIELIFPRSRFDEISAAAQASGIDPVLVFSLIKQESGFDREALSSSGAKGLMQLMPFTAVDTRPGIELRMLASSKTNVEVGSEYLSSLIKRFDGNWALALAGYNAGPYAVDRWLKNLREKKDPSIYEFIESIPYKETREYVSSIMRNYWWYSSLIKKTTPDLDNLFWQKTSSK